MEIGSQVTIEYSLFLEDGSEVASNVGDEPLVYEHGAHQILPALEQRLDDAGPGDTRRVTLGPEEAFGQADPDAVQLVPHQAVPEEARRQGAQLRVQDTSGNEHSIRVKEVRDEGVVLDFNHPLAGATITFEIRVLDVRPSHADGAPRTL